MKRQNAHFSLLLSCFFGILLAVQAHAADEFSQAKSLAAHDTPLNACTKNCDCEIRLGLEGALKPFASIADISESACRESCKSTSDHWDQRSLSTLCLYRGKTIASDNVGLMDVNWASCEITTEPIKGVTDSKPANDSDKRRTSRRICVRECADRVKAQGKQKSAIHCEWDGTHLSDQEIAQSRGLFL